MILCNALNSSNLHLLILIHAHRGHGAITESAKRSLMCSWSQKHACDSPGDREYRHGLTEPVLGSTESFVPSSILLLVLEGLRHEKKVVMVVYSSIVVRVSNRDRRTEAWQENKSLASWRLIYAWYALGTCENLRHTSDLLKVRNATSQFDALSLPSLCIPLINQPQS
jgi:hypothetical protein